MPALSALNALPSTGSTPPPRAAARRRLFGTALPEPRRYTVSAESRCICAVSVLYLALYFRYGGASAGVTVQLVAGIKKTGIFRHAVVS
eukprot:1193963-Prymnesium_polylepis.1